MVAIQHCAGGHDPQSLLSCQGARTGKPGGYFMRLLDRYLGREVILSAIFAVCTLSLVLILGQIFRKLFEFVVDHNVPATFIITFIAYFLPLSLIFSIPWGFLTAVLLVFGRLSAGNELTALRTAGVSIPRIARPVLLLAFVFSGICLWINLYVAPRAQQNLKDAFFQVATSNPAAVFSGDTVITDFPGKKIYVGSKEGGRLQNVHVFELNPDNKAVEVVYAHFGRLETDLANKQIKMRLQDTRFEQRDNSLPDDFTKIKDGITMGDFVFPISLEELYAKKHGRPKVESLTYDGLKAEVQRSAEVVAADKAKLRAGGGADPDLLRRTTRDDISKLAAIRTEFNKRFSFSLACVTFALMGIPLGITAHRQETSIGFGISLGVAFSYFLIIIVVNTMRSNAHLHPELLIWTPNVIFLLLGGFLFFRLCRR
jgi:lipopolysaccharide export LptBFGC system permease protein LptF